MALLFSDILLVDSLNKAGKKFERVNRLHCSGSKSAVDIIIDVNCELFPVQQGSSIAFALAKSISLDGSADDGNYDPTFSASGSLMKDYDYVMHGRLFSIKHTNDQKMEIQVSFGGLLMKLKGPQTIMDPFTMDMM